MKLKILSAGVCAAFAFNAGLAWGEEAKTEAAPAAAAPATAPPPPPYTITANANLATDYYFRGLTQTWHKPAVQGGFDFNHSSGIYAGTWASNVSGNSYPGGSMEWDLYGGYNGKITDDFGYTVGGLYYLYLGANANQIPGSTIDQKPNTFEINGGLSYQWLSVKISYALTNYFGASKAAGAFTDDTKGTYYLDLTGNYPLANNYTINAHLGYTHYSKEMLLPTSINPNATGSSLSASYADWKLGVTKGFDGGWSVSAAVVGATKKALYDKYPSAYNVADTKNLGSTALIFTVGRSF